VPQETVPCPRCNPRGSGFNWSRNPTGLCPVCLGSRQITEYRLFDPKKPASRLQRLLQTVVVFAFVLLCLSYVSRITQKVDTLHQERGARSGLPPLSPAVYPEGVSVPLVATDMPARCAGHSSDDACRDVVAEFNGGYGAIKCGYDIGGTGRRRFYFFWLNKVPSHLVAMARNDPKASVRALGSAAVQQCPPTLEAADSQYEQNIQ
jgi:hypothetical protein